MKSGKLLIRIGLFCALTALARAAFADNNLPLFQEEHLLRAAKQGNVSKLNELLEGNVSVNCVDETDWTPLHLAIRGEDGRRARGGSPEAVKLLLEKEANPNAVGENGWTPLHWAAAKGDVESARLLLEARADINAVDRWQRTPVSVAAHHGKIEVIKLIIAHARVHGQRLQAH